MKRKKRSPIGCLFWIALILLLIVIFLMSRSRIEKVMAATGFNDLIKKKIETTTPLVIREPESKKTIPVPSSGNKPSENGSKIPSTKTSTKTPSPKNKTTIIKKIESQKKQRKSVLYFVLVSDNGKITLKPVTRTVSFIDSPLTETIKDLIQGLTPSELNRGLISLIPDNTKLLGISIKNSTAFINFNDSVKFNSFGEEGILTSLKQIVYTATEFKTVSKVQILINGKIEKYLTSEGIFVGAPLSRNSFK